jgi:hypothetical protein
MPPLPKRPTPEDRAVHDRTTAILLASDQLFNTAYPRYIHEGRGACVVFFHSLEEVRDKTHQFVIQYVDLVTLLRLNYPNVCELTKVYNVSACFVLLVGVIVDCTRTFVCVIAHRDTGKQMRENDTLDLNILSRDLQPVTGTLSRVVTVPLYTQLAPTEVDAMVTVAPGANEYCAHLTCTTLGHLQCGRCRTTKYCSRKCQKEDWTRHKVSCT